MCCVVRWAVTSSDAITRALNDVVHCDVLLQWAVTSSDAITRPLKGIVCCDVFLWWAVTSSDAITRALNGVVHCDVLLWWAITSSDAITRWLNGVVHCDELLLYRRRPINKSYLKAFLTARSLRLEINDDETPTVRPISTRTLHRLRGHVDRMRPGCPHSHKREGISYLSASRDLSSDPIKTAKNIFVENFDVNDVKNDSHDLEPFCDVVKSKKRRYPVKKNTP